MALFVWHDIVCCQAISAFRVTSEESVLSGLLRMCMGRFIDRQSTRVKFFIATIYTHARSTMTAPITDNDLGQERGDQLWDTLVVMVHSLN